MSDMFDAIRALADKVEPKSSDDAADLRHYAGELEEALKKTNVSAMYEVFKAAEKISDIADKY